MAVRDESERESEEQRSEEAVRLGKAVEGLDTIGRSFVGLEQVCRLGLDRQRMLADEPDEEKDVSVGIYETTDSPW